jgi:hypothetical protein
MENRAKYHASPAGRIPDAGRWNVAGFAVHEHAILERAPTPWSSPAVRAS